MVPSSKLALTMSMASWLVMNSHTPSEASTINLSPAWEVLPFGHEEEKGVREVLPPRWSQRRQPNKYISKVLRTYGEYALY